MSHFFLSCQSNLLNTCKMMLMLRRFARHLARQIRSMQHLRNIRQILQKNLSCLLDLRKISMICRLVILLPERVREVFYFLVHFLKLVHQSANDQVLVSPRRPAPIRRQLLQTDAHVGQTGTPVVAQARSTPRVPVSLLRQLRLQSGMLVGNHSGCWRARGSCEQVIRKVFRVAFLLMI